jgi:hypothetical protein
MLVAIGRKNPSTLFEAPCVGDLSQHEELFY